MVEREHWRTRIGLILAMAGNAIGLGNFLRFPTQAAANGGGAYIIPYFISLILLGIPLMWLEWAMGRYGGERGHGSPPGILFSVYPKRISVYLGVIGLFISFIITVYYTYIESWTLSYAISSFLGKLPKPPEEFKSYKDFTEPFGRFLIENIGETNIKKICIGGGERCLEILSPSLLFYFVFVITLAINLVILGRGISGGIERFALFAMPVLFLFALILVVRVFTLKSPHGITLDEALGFLWEPKLDGLKNPETWLNAAGQIFFTLSIGISIIMTYASYVERDKDIALSGLTTASLNEFAEVILGSSIALTAAVIFFGVNEATEIAQGGAFRLGFVSMPAIFMNIPAGAIFGGIWFLLLFIAGITSSIALASPFVSLLEDEFGIPRKRTVLIVGIIWFILAQFPIFVREAIDEMDFWAGTIGLVVFALIEVIYFAWILGEKRAYEEIMRGAQIKVPKIFIYIMKYISPLYIILLLVFWVYDKVRHPTKIDLNILITRIVLITVFISMLVITHIAWTRNSKKSVKEHWSE